MAVSRPQRLQRPSARVMALPISIRWQLKQEAELLQLTAETQCRGAEGDGWMVIPMALLVAAENWTVL